MQGNRTQATDGTARQVRSPYWLFPAAVLLLSLAMTFAGHNYLLRQAKAVWQENIARESALVASEIRDRLRAHAQFLRSIRAFVMASDAVSPAEWREFARQLQIENNVPGLQAYGYARLAGSLAGADTGPSQRSASGADRNASAQLATAPRLPIIYLAPHTPRNETTLGYDLLSEPRRAQAIISATERDDVVLSRRIELVQDADSGVPQPGLLMVLPVYHGNTTGTVDERKRALVGVVYATYRMSDLVASFNFANAGLLSLRILDDDSFNSDRQNGGTRTLLYDAAPPAEKSLAEEREIEFGQRNWHLEFFAERKIDPTGELGYLLGAGILVSVLLAAASWLQATHRRRAERYARDVTAELRQSEERFKLALDGTEDGIWDQDLVSGSFWQSERLLQILMLPASAGVQAFLSGIHPDDRERFDDSVRTALAARQAFSAEFRFRCEDGRWSWLRARGRGAYGNEGRAVRITGAITDISEQRQAEIRLQQYRDFLATVLRSIPHPVFAKNAAREYVAANTAFCRLVGRNERDVGGHTNVWPLPLPEPLARQLADIDDRVFASGDDRNDEILLRLPDGLHTFILSSARASDSEGQPILIGAMTDISELRAAERARLRADLQRRAILDAATEVAVIATDGSGTITLFNKGAEKMLGYAADEVTGHETPLRFHLREEVQERASFLSAEIGIPVNGFDTFAAIPRLHGSERREWTYVRRDGSRLTASLVVTAVHDESGNITGYLGIAIDTTERNRALADLNRQSARMATIIENIPGGVSLIDSKLNFIAANAELLRVLDFPESLFANGPPSLYEVALFNARRGEYGPGDPQAIAMAIVEKARNPVAHVFERTRPNGRTLEVRGTPLPDGGFVTIYTDVTARKEVEAELVKHRDHLQALVEERTAGLLAAKEAAERASAAKSEFLANISHELRTPMHSILSFAALGNEKATSVAPEKLAHYFQRIHQSGERLLGLLNSLLDLAKLEAGMMLLAPAVQDVLPAIREAVAEAEGWAGERGLRIVAAIDCEDTAAAVDRDRFGQVLRNLLSNAIKFSPPGGTVTIALAESTLPRGRRSNDPSDLAALQIVVSDDGVGIPEEELESIFDKFVQSSLTKSGAGGTGLGLSICREIVIAHRGAIRACNNPQGGASFIVTLPRTLPSLPPRRPA